MARVSTYLNFSRSTEEAFNFYRNFFGTEFVGPIARFGDIRRSRTCLRWPRDAHYGALRDCYGVQWMFN